MLKLSAIVTKSGVFLKEMDTYSPQLKKYRFDGEEPVSTWDRDWFKVTSLPKVVTRSRLAGKVNYRFELKDPSLACEKIPQTLPHSVLVIEDDDKPFWKKEYRHLESLYFEHYDLVDAGWEEVQFEITSTMTFDDEVNFKGFAYPINSDCILKHNLVDNIKYSTIDKIIFPAPILVKRPCKLSSADSYRIIRQHVRINIDPKQSTITSDYDFCFEVSKNITIHTPYEYRQDVSNFGSKRPKYITKLCNDRKKVIFEMTDDKHQYAKYTVIKGFEGESAEDLQNNIDSFLKELMEKINEPLIDCPHCEGRGVVTKKA